MFRITKTLFRPLKVVPYQLTVSETDKVPAKLKAAKTAAPGYIGTTTHRTSATSMVTIEEWDNKESFLAYKAANDADLTATRVANKAYRKSNGIKISVFSEVI